MESYEIKDLVQDGVDKAVEEILYKQMEVMSRKEVEELVITLYSEGFSHES